MKATELKIGDYFIFKHKDVKVCLSDGDICVTANGECLDARIEDLSPMPLNMEILEKNEWEDVDFNEWRKKLPCGYLWLDAYNNRGETWYSVGIKNGTDGVDLHDIRFVHELQHILWALGMDDNMEI